MPLLQELYIHTWLLKLVAAPDDETSRELKNSWEKFLNGGFVATDRAYSGQRNIECQKGLKRKRGGGGFLSYLVRSVFCTTAVRFLAQVNHL